MLITAPPLALAHPPTGRERPEQAPNAAERTGCDRPFEELLASYFDHADREFCIIAGFDRHLHLVSFENGAGTAWSNDQMVRTLRAAVAPPRTAAILIAHNHLCGSAQPSKADIRATHVVANLSRLLDIRLLDHLIFAQGQISSFRALALI